MSAQPVSWWTRLAYTPVSEAVRGQFTASLDWQAKLNESGLPHSAQSLIASVVRRTRLWRHEKADVAQELTAHFLDGLSQGRAADQLAAEFGEPTRVATLIRRAKKRNRAWHWQVRHRALQVLGILALLYVVVIAITLSRHPSPKIDYLAKANARPSPPPRPTAPGRFTARSGQNTPSGRWIAVTFGCRVTRTGSRRSRGCRENSAWLEKLRQAAAKPAFGLPAGFAWDYRAEDARVLFGEGWKPPSRPEEDDPRRLRDEILADALLPHLAKLKAMAMWLAADVAWAGEQGDGARIVADYQAILGTARHCREQAFLINQLVAIANTTIANRAVALVLQRHPEAVSETALVELAHALATSVDYLGVDFRGERMMFQDIVQRIYSDDGEGGGRLTLEGMRLLAQLGLAPEDLREANEAASVFPYLDHSDLGGQAVSAAIAPVAAELFASRRELMSEYDRLMSLMEAEATRPLWVQLRQPSVADREIEALASSPSRRMKYAPIARLLPAGNAARKSAESEAFSRTLAVAVALEVYHRQHSAYPETLDQLAPQWLPHVPLDASTGQPLLYRVDEGRPILYGRGWDAVDDGGEMTDKAIKAWPRLSSDESDTGDWVLYPPPARELASGADF